MIKTDSFLIQCLYNCILNILLFEMLLIIFKKNFEFMFYSASNFSAVTRFVTINFVFIQRVRYICIISFYIVL